MPNTNPDLIALYAVNVDLPFEEWAARFPFYEWKGRRARETKMHVADPATLLTTGVLRSFSGSVIPDAALAVEGTIEDASLDAFSLRCLRKRYDTLYSAAVRVSDAQEAAREAAPPVEEAPTPAEPEEGEGTPVKLIFNKGGTVSVRQGRGNIAKIALDDLQLAVSAVAGGVNLGSKAGQARLSSVVMPDGEVRFMLDDGVLFYSH